MIQALSAESHALNVFKYRLVEKAYLSGSKTTVSKSKSTKVSNTSHETESCDDIVSEIVKARQIIQLSLASTPESSAAVGGSGGYSKLEEALVKRVVSLEKTVQDLASLVKSLTLKVQSLEK